jgi:hypothetical protein
MIYILLIIFMFTLCFKFQPKSHKSFIQIYYFTLFGLFLFSAFRFGVGCDWIAYQKMFDNAKGIDWLFIQKVRDPLFWTLLRWANNMDLSYPFINIISSAIFFIGVHILARRQPNPLSFLVLMFPILIINMPMSAIRQGAAIGLICIALVAIIDKRPIHFLLWGFLAAGFHTSALAIIALLPFATGRFNYTRFVIAALLACLVLIILFYSGSAERASSVYIGTHREAYGAPYRIGMLTLSALYFLLFVKKKWQQTFPQDYNIVILGVIGMILIVFLVPVSTIISDRYGYYLIPLQAMIFARLPYLRFKSNQWLYCVLPYLGLFITFIIWTQISYHFNACYIPYDSWIFGLPSTIE